MHPKTNTQWKKHIAKLKRSTKLTLKDKIKAKKAVAKALTLAIKQRLPKTRFGIMFSGGVDSSVIALIAKNLCKKDKSSIICYSVGLKNADDLKWAKKAAKKLKLKLKTKTISMDEAEKTIKKVAKLVPKVDILSIGVGSVIYTAMEMAKKDKIKTIFTGLGAEEIFAGYERHTGCEKKDFNEKSIQKQCWKGLLTLWNRDMKRDLAIANHFKIKIETPFLDEELIKTAMSIPAKYKVNKKQKKIILREAAQSIRLPKDIASRKKKAAQYGSNFDKAIKKIAKKRGFRYKKEFLRTLNP